jgi:hypothetical protein
MESWIADVHDSAPASEACAREIIEVAMQIINTPAS